MPTPSAQILAAAETTRLCRDSLGRELTIRRMTALDRLRLFKALGPILSQNSAYLGMAMLASAVTAVDGVPVPVALTEAHIETLVARLGDAGIAAVAEAYSSSSEAQRGSADQGN